MAGVLVWWCGVVFGLVVCCGCGLTAGLVCGFVFLVGGFVFLVFVFVCGWFAGSVWIGVSRRFLLGVLALCGLV